ncbi:ABC transporter substrate-binding protein [Diaminobutyricimonas sp. TR449]|uniref:ABC transporter substrate-binding protein n=1 Tax=Diaminobutyricimonas sp. TR449 TaxID=2708076 RepID=UPI0014205813|nr:ABC transporter substrate-binding protein [Diaminobutyricimonas sp. TR449]
MLNRSTMSRKRRLGAVIASIALVGLLAACSGSPSTEEAEDVTFVFPIPSDPITLNPALSTSPEVQVMASALYEPLVRITNEYELVPTLAESWDVSEDGLEYTFHLREGVTWHDGEDFTADDVKFNFENVMELHPSGGNIKRVLENVEIVDDHTVKVHLTRPSGPFIEILTGQRMLPEHILAGQDILTADFNFDPIGTGPFMFESYTSGQAVVAAKYDDYWRETGDVERVFFQIIPDANSRGLVLQSGEVDGMYSPFLTTTALVDTLADPLWVWENDHSGMSTVVNMNFNTTENPILADAEVRKALYTAIDRAGVSSKALSGVTKEPRSMIPLGVQWAYDPAVDYRKLFPYDPKGAAAELDRLGYPAAASGERFSLDLVVIANAQTAIASAEYIKSNLEEIGVAVNLEVLDPPIFLEKGMANREFDLIMWNGYSFQDPTQGTVRYYRCNPDNIPNSNNSGMCTPELEEVLQKGAEANGREARAEFYSEAQHLAAEVLFAAPIAEDQARTFVRNDRWDNLDGFLALEGRDWAPLTSKK